MASSTQWTRVLEWGAIAFSEGYYEVLLNKVSKVLNSV